MCSICGYIQHGAPVTDFIPVAHRLMQHRGPDHAGTITKDNVHLGHQRLAIIDLDERSNQPFVLEGHYIVFNGEIFNFRELRDKYGLEDQLTTESDTEVLLVLLMKYGLKILNELNGMFAFAWFDEASGKLHLVRDRFGIKPLFFTIHNHNFYFASEFKPLAKLRGNFTPNNNIIQSLLKESATDYDGQTWDENISQLRAGHFMTIAVDQPKGGIAQEQWYFFSDYQLDTNRLNSFSQATSYFEELLTDSLRLRLISDVPVAITLSGGLDSSTLYTLARHNLQYELDAFSFDHRQSDVDESEKVLTMVKRLKGEVNFVSAGQETSNELYMKSLQSLEFPIWNHSHLAYYETYRKIKNANYTVLIEGHGADEILGGYQYMVHPAFKELLSRRKYFLAWKVYNNIWEILNSKLYGREEGSAFSRFKDFFYLMRHNEPSKESFDDVLEDSFTRRILPINLRCFDRLPMAHALESRSPFLDYRLVELARKLPIHFKINTLGTKAILRNILKQHGLHEIAADKVKTGFSSDITKFFNQEENKSRLIKQKVSISNPLVEDFIKQHQLDEKLKSRDIDWSTSEKLSKWYGLSAIFDYYQNQTMASSHHSL